MSNLLYLGLVVLLSVIGSIIVWYRTRKPKSLESGIDEFHRELRALAPEQRRQARDRWASSNRGEQRSG